MQLIGEALTFDDVSLVPAYSAILPRDVRIETQLTRGLRLNMPLISAAMFRTSPFFVFAKFVILKE